MNLPHLRRLSWAVLLVGICSLPRPATGEDEDGSEDADVMGDITVLPALNVAADRIDDFGFRVSAAYDARRSGTFRRVYTPVVDVLLPNTPASRAGLRPGDRIVSSDGKSTASGTFSIKKWRRIQEEKWAAHASGTKQITWTLEVEEPATGDLRTLHLRVPTPAPRWGAETWAAPEGRTPAVVAETGPLAQRAKEVLDHGIWVILRDSYVRGLDLGYHANAPYFLAHQWTLNQGGLGHRIFVSQERGRTDIVLEVIVHEANARFSQNAPNAAPVPGMTSPTTVFANRSRAYLTSPSGALEKAWALGGRGRTEVSLDDVRAEFSREVDFWLHHVGRVSPRWPLGVLPTTGREGNSGATIAASTAPADAVDPANCPRAPAFLRLPRATADEQALVEHALAGLGAEENRWAYTETVRPMDGGRALVVRVDPSQPEPEQYRLIAIDGRTANSDEIQRWRDEEHEPPHMLGEFAGIRDKVDRTDVRIFRREPAAIVFELPLCEIGSAGDSPEAFQALFRVNQASRTLEDIVVRMREPMRMSGAAKLTDVGVEVRFRTIDPAYPPQPVSLRSSGAVQMLSVKVHRGMRIERTEFRRISHPASAPAPASAASSPAAK